MSNYSNVKSVSECLSILGITVISETQSEYSVYCVYNDCDKDSKGKEAHLGISKETGQFKCTKCGASGNMVTLADHLGFKKSVVFNEEVKRTKTPKKPVEKTNPDEMDSFCQILLNYPDKIKYLNERLITNEMIEKYSLGYGKLNGMGYGKYIIPIKNIEGNVIFYKARKDPSIEGDTGPKYLTHPTGNTAHIFGHEIIKANNEIFICEGEFDCMVMRSMGLPAVTSTHGCGSFKAEWKGYFAHCKSIYFAYDNDFAGKNSAKKDINLFYETGINLFNINLPYVPNKSKTDMTDYFLAGGSAEDLKTRYAIPIIFAINPNKKQDALIKPSDVNVEYNLLNAILSNDKLLFSIIDIIDEKDFYYKNFGIIFGIVRDIVVSHKPLDELVIANRLEAFGKTNLPSELRKFYPLKAISIHEDLAVEWASIIKEKSTQRILIEIGNGMASDGYREKDESNKIIADVFNKLMRLKDLKNKRSPMNLKESMAETVDIIQKRALSPNKYGGIYTGFQGIDLITEGFHKQELIYLSAKPSYGKTTFLLNIMVHMAKKMKNVLLFSIEMKRELVTSRILSNYSSINGMEYRKGIAKDDAIKMNKIHCVQRDHDNLNFIIDDNRLDIDDLPSLANKYKVMYGVDLIGIDHFDLIEYSRAKYNSNDTSMGKEISRKLKNLASTLDIPIVVVATLKKMVGEKPVLSDLKGSGSLGFDADHVIFLHNESKERLNKDDDTSFEEPKVDTVEAIVAKCRNGITGSAMFLFYKEYYRFVENEY